MNSLSKIVNFSLSETISETDVEHWREQEFLVVAQSLDGDYLAGTLEQTFVIPSSLYKEDIEQFDKQLIDFLLPTRTKKSLLRFYQRIIKSLRINFRKLFLCLMLDNVLRHLNKWLLIPWLVLIR